MNLRAIKQAVEDYAHDRLDLAGLERELEYIFGIRERPIVPTNFTTIHQAAFYGLITKDEARERLEAQEDAA